MMQTNHRNHPSEQTVKDTADLIYFFMLDQGTHESAGTFNAWLRDEIPTITAEGVANMWKWVHRG